MKTEQEIISLLVASVERATFTDPHDQHMIYQILWDTTLSLRQLDIKYKRTVWSCVRRCASLIPQEDTERLIILLDEDSVVDTTLVGLQAIETVFSAEPAKEGEYPDLVNRVDEIATKFITSENLIAGENSAIANAAVKALAVLKSDRVSYHVKRAEELKQDWFIRILKNSLSGLQILEASVPDQGTGCISY